MSVLDQIFHLSNTDAPLFSMVHYKIHGLLYLLNFPLISSQGFLVLHQRATPIWGFQQRAYTCISLARSPLSSRRTAVLWERPEPQEGQQSDQRERESLSSQPDLPWQSGVIDGTLSWSQSHGCRRQWWRRVSSLTSLTQHSAALKPACYRTQCPQIMLLWCYTLVPNFPSSSFSNFLKQT